MKILFFLTSLVLLGCSQSSNSPVDKLTKAIKDNATQKASQNGQQVEAVAVTYVTETKVPSGELLTCITAGVNYKGLPIPSPSTVCIAEGESKALSKALLEVAKSAGAVIVDNQIVFITPHGKMTYSNDGKRIKDIRLGEVVIEVSREP